MIVINFSHPFSAEQLAQIEDVLGAPPEQIITVPFSSTWPERTMSC